MGIPVVGDLTDFSANTTISSAEVDANYAYLINCLADGTKSLNVGGLQAGGAAQFTSSVTFTGATTFGSAIQAGNDITFDLASYGMYKSPTVSMVWTSVSQITMQAGRYVIGGKVYTLASNSVWSWTLDTGAEAISTWYYLYAYLSGGTVTPIASTTAPTALWDTSLSGTTYDTNIYLGAFYNDSGSDILKFMQCGNVFHMPPQMTAETASTSWESNGSRIPTTASFQFGQIYSFNNTTATVTPGVASDAAGAVNYEDRQTATRTAFGGGNFFLLPVETAQTIYMKVLGGNGTDDKMETAIHGWHDKWL